MINNISTSQANFVTLTSSNPYGLGVKVVGLAFIVDLQSDKKLLMSPNS